MLVREAAAGGALEPAGQEGETGLPRRPGATRARGQGMGPRAGATSLLTCPWGWEGHPGSSRAAGRRRGTQRSPRCRVTAPGVAAVGCPWDSPAHRQCPAGPQHRCPAAGSRGVSPSRQCPVTYRQRVPAACKRRAGLDGAAGERHQARATSHQDRLGGDTGPSLRPGLNQGAAICSPKISDTPNFCVFLGFNQSTLGCSAGLGTRIQPSARQGLGPGGTQGDVALSPPSNQQWAPIFRAGPASPCQAPLQARRGRGCSEARAGDTAQGQGDSLGSGPHVTLQ